AARGWRGGRRRGRRAPAPRPHGGRPRRRHARGRRRPASNGLPFRYHGGQHGEERNTPMTIHDEYRAKHAKSAALWERSRQSIPAGITHDIRHLTPFLTYVERAAGTRPSDVADNEYIDYS